MLVTALSHLVIDRTKIELTLAWRARSGGAAVGRDVEPALEPDVVARCPAPGSCSTSWPTWQCWSSPGPLFLAAAEPLDWWQDLVARIAARTDGDAVGRAVLVVLVLTSLVIVNVRAGSLFVDTLVRAPRPPLVADARDPRTRRPRRGIGSTIGIIERLLISALVLAGGVLAIGLVVAAKTLARFKQLDDRDFAEYYLLGTLASVTFAVVTSLVALRALA